MDVLAVLPKGAPVRLLKAGAVGDGMVYDTKPVTGASLIHVEDDRPDAQYVVLRHT